MESLVPKSKLEKTLFSAGFEAFCLYKRYRALFYWSLAGNVVQLVVSLVR